MRDLPLMSDPWRLFGTTAIPPDPETAGRIVHLRGHRSDGRRGRPAWPPSHERVEALITSRELLFHAIPHYSSSTSGYFQPHNLKCRFAVASTMPRGFWTSSAARTSSASSVPL